MVLKSSEVAEAWEHRDGMLFIVYVLSLYANADVIAIVYIIYTFIYIERELDEI